MAYRKISVSMWDDVWFVELSKDAKLLFIYLVTNSMCNQAGMYVISMKKLEFETGISRDRITSLFEELQDKVEFFEKDRVVWVKNFSRYQTTNKFFLISAIKSIKLLPQKYLERWIAYNTELLNQYLSQNEIENLVSMGSDQGSKERLNPPSDPIPQERQIPITLPSDTSTDNRITDGSNQKPDNRVQITGANIVSSSHTESLKENMRRDNKNSSCPCKEIVELYHQILPELPKVKVFTDLRRKLLQARWKENIDRQNLQWWKNYFEFVRKSDFLMGKIIPKDGRSPFRADFEWLIRSNNMIKIIEGKYHPANWWDKLSSTKTSSNWVLLSKIMEQENG